MIRSTLLFVIMTYSLFCCGQDDSTVIKKYSGAYFGLVLESPQFQVDWLNDYLRDLEMSPFQLPIIVAGVGAQVHHNRWVVQANFNLGKRKQSSDSSFSYSRYNSVGATIGFDLIGNPKIALYPFIGFKAYDISYWFTEKLEDDADFEVYLSSDQQFKEIRYTDAHFDVGLGFSYQTYYLINLRSGLMIPNKYELWETIDDVVLYEGPHVNFMYYVSLVIGLGGNFSDDGNGNAHRETTPAVYTNRMR